MDDYDVAKELYRKIAGINYDSAFTVLHDLLRTKIKEKYKTYKEFSRDNNLKYQDVMDAFSAACGAKTIRVMRAAGVGEDEVLKTIRSHKVEADRILAEREKERIKEKQIKAREERAYKRKLKERVNKAKKAGVVTWVECERFTGCGSDWYCDEDNHRECMRCAMCESAITKRGVYYLDFDSYELSIDDVDIPNEDIIYLKIRDEEGSRVLIDRRMKQDDGEDDERN